jgi:putative lipoprotein
MFSNQPYDRIPGQWGGVVFTAKSHDNVLDHCEIHSGDFGIRCDSSSVDFQKLILRNSLIHNVGGDGLYARQCAVNVGNSQITNAAGDCVRLIGGRNEFVHCTIGQFYALAGDRGVALHFSNYGEGSRAPLERASFVNCIISGYNNDDLMRESSTRYKNDAFNYDFSYCLLNTPKPTTDEHFRNCLFEQDSPEARRQAGNFSPSFDLQKLLFVFTLDAKSAAVGKADFAVTQQTFPFDRNGKSQTKGGKSDMGCYRHVEP